MQIFQTEQCAPSFSRIALIIVCVDEMNMTAKPKAMQPRYGNFSFSVFVEPVIFKLHIGGNIYAMIDAVEAPINSNNAPRLHVVNEIVIVIKTRAVVNMI